MENVSITEREHIYQLVECSSDERQECVPSWVTVVDPLVPLPVIWKRSPIKNWPLLWHAHDTICQRQRTIGIFSKWGRQSYRENKAILSIKIFRTQSYSSLCWSLSNLSHSVSYCSISQIWVSHVSTSWFMSHLSVTYSIKPNHIFT